MPRERRRRRERKRDQRDQPAQSRTPAPPPLDAVEPARRFRFPSASVIFSLCIGIWLGLLFGDLPGTVPTIFLWISVIGAGLSAGRLLRAWLVNRQSRPR